MADICAAPTKLEHSQTAEWGAGDWAEYTHNDGHYHDHDNADEDLKAAIVSR